MGLFDRFQRSPDPKVQGEKSDVKESEVKPECPPPVQSPKRIKIPLNKTTTEVSLRNNTLVFPCPICEVLNTVPIQELHPVLGGEPMCQNCQDMLHIPGGFRTGYEVKSLRIYAGLPVAIRKFYIFYQNHPVIRQLEEEGISRIIIQYGVWGFCQKCHHEFSPAVLMNLPQTKCDIVDYRSLSSSEMNEMQSLRKGACPYCGHRILLVIISDVPHYVISASENLSHRWEED